MSIAVAFSILSLFPASVLAASISAVTNNIVYAWGDTLTITGTINSTVATPLTATIFNISSNYSIHVMNTSSTISSGGTPNTFSISNAINDSYSPDYYIINLTDGTDSVYMSITVVSLYVYLEPHLIGSSSILNISTSTVITSGNASYLGGNFSEVVALSQSSPKKIFYGNDSSTGKTYHFVVVDEKYAGSYDTLYISDTKMFQMYNSSVPSPKVKTAGEGINLNGADYVIWYIDFTTGDKVILARPIYSNIYSPNASVNFVVIAKNVRGQLAANEGINASLLNSNGDLINQTIGTTDSSGVFTYSFLAPSIVGTYSINVNYSIGVEFFSVESFKLYGKITDLSDNPTSTFAPNPIVRISATVKNSTDYAVNPSSIYATVSYPDGTSQDLILTGGNGTFSHDLNLAGAPQGQYAVKITATYSGDTQEFSTGFSIRSVTADVMAINTQFINEAQGSEAFVDAFAPNTNVTLMAVLSDVSKGGFFAKGPEGEGGIDIDNASTAVDECNTSVSIVSVEDDRGVDITSNISYQVMNLTNAINYLKISEGEGGGPPQAMMRQCMIIFTAPTRTGMYRIKINVNHAGGDNSAGTTFGVEKYYATANPVDFTGEKDFWFYAPNSTIYIKLKVTDLATRQELNATNITDATIVEMFSEWPSYQDMLAGSYRPNESIVAEKGMLNFTTPDSEGFFDFRFRFKTTDGEEGLGTGFFMLKKYMIWGETAGCTMQPCMSAPGRNVILNVKIIPINKADRLDQGVSDLSQIGCGDTCNGFVASVNSIWTDQQMKNVPTTDYTVINGTIFNSTANVTIVPGPNMPTGWFGVDLILTDMLTGNTYFGWAGFEIRRVMIITDGIETDGLGNFTFKQGQTFGVGQPILFGVTARNPAAPGDQKYLPNHTLNPNFPNITSVNLETVMLMSQNGPPMTLQRGVDYDYTVRLRNVSRGPGDQEEYYVVNITGLSKTGQMRADVKINTSNLGSDMWSFWFETSSYFVQLNYRGKENWPPTFASNEYLMVNITGMNFDGSSHNLSVTGTRLKMGYDKVGNPKRINSTVTCIDGVYNNCGKINMTVDLSQFGTGQFDLDIAINDTEGVEKGERIFLAIKGLTVSIPNIDEFWIGSTDTPTRELNLDNDRDTCDNQRYLESDIYSSNMYSLGIENTIQNRLQKDDCPGETYKICIANGHLNFTVSSKAGNQSAMGYCVLDNGTLNNIVDCESVLGVSVYVVGNGSYLWFNTSNVTLSQANFNISMAGIQPNVTGHSVNTLNRIWDITAVGNTTDPQSGQNVTYYNYIDRYIMQISLCNQTAYLNNCTDSDPQHQKAWVDVRVLIPRADVWMYVSHFCASPNGTLDYDNNNEIWTPVFCNASSGQIDYYIVSNTTHVWYNSNASLLASPALSNGGTMTFDSRPWKIYGNQMDGALRLTFPETYNTIGFSGRNITVSSRYNNNYGGAFCVRGGGDWQFYSGNCSDTPVYVVSNYSHFWIGGTNDLSAAVPRANGTTFTFAGKSLIIVENGTENNPNAFRVKSAIGACGEMQNVTCQQECQGSCNCPNIGYNITLPGQYSSNYHGYITNLIDWNNVAQQFGQPFNYNRPVYIYHNTTHVWMTNSTDLSSAPMAGINDLISDPYGGLWRVKLINTRTVKLEGQNILGGSGAFINTSYSKSGTFRIEPLREEQLGGWDRMTESQRGLDLSGDELKNSTVYVVVADNETTGVYDTFFFSSTNNFTNPIPIAANRSTRTFGNNDQLTLLSITSLSGVKVKAYSANPTDWADLGEFKIGTNVTIPILVKTPAGGDALANVSIGTIRFEPTNQPSQYFTLSSPVRATISGIGEITVNLSALGFTQSGRYVFGITATNSSEEKLEEWKWPSATMRSFLVDSDIGKGGYVGPFYPLPLSRYDWENYNWMPDIQEVSVNEIGRNFSAVFANERGDRFCDFTPPAEADINNANWTFNMQNSNYWLYINSGNESKVWIKNGDCNFSTGAQLKSVNDPVNIAINDHTYMLYVLDVNVTGQSSKGVVIGLENVNKSLIKPLQYDNNGMARWRLLALNLSGTLYDVLLANDTVDYPMCSIWNMGDCAKVAYFKTNGNFSGVNPTRIGENFTSDLYLAKVGPGSGDGVLIGNFSSIAFMYPSLPGMDLRPKDNTPSYFAKLDESVLNLDLNENGVTSDVFYAVAYDDKQDSEQVLTNVLVDDDLNMTDNGWANYSANSSLPGYYKDFYGDEVGTRELNGNLPRGVWGGNIQFNESSNWWDISRYNVTHTLLKMHKWPFSVNENITLTLKAFEFNQSGIPNANITIERVLQFVSNNFPVELTGYSVVGQNVTDSGGYVVLNINKGSWNPGNYNVRMRVDASGSRTETNDIWFTMQ